MTVLELQFFMEAFQGLNLLCYNLYIVIRFIVLLTYNLLCRFNYANNLHRIQVS